jgi:ribonuclease P protein component
MNRASDHAPLPTPRSAHFPRRMKLSGGGQFARVYKSSQRISCDPLVLHGIPNTLGFVRIGMAVPRRVGSAVVRNRIKRLIREVFRHAQHDWPGAYDVVISVQPHQVLTLNEYRQAIAKGMQTLHERWSRKSRTTPRAS